jgi:hypothetical protein
LFYRRLRRRPTRRRGHQDRIDLLSAPSPWISPPLGPCSLRAWTPMRTIGARPSSSSNRYATSPNFYRGGRKPGALACHLGRALIAAPLSCRGTMLITSHHSRSRRPPVSWTVCSTSSRLSKTPAHAYPVRANPFRYNTGCVLVLHRC